MSQPPDARPYPKADRPRILVVDDDQLIRRLVVKSLEADFAILEADSGTAGLSLARNQPPDLILLDLMMPGMDGYAVCQAFRQSSATASIPILMLTALDQVDSKVKGLRTGA
ncbi:MAG: response regulator, partial [Chloroflexi bacterium]|nr:response regulator [Chloroflexota bacterium]